MCAVKGCLGRFSKDWKYLAPSQSSICALTHLLKSETVPDTIRTFAANDIVSLPIPTRTKDVAIDKEMIDLGIVFKAETVIEAI